MIGRIVSNRITRRLSQATVRALGTYSASRNVLNFVYLRLTYSQRATFHRNFSRIYRDRDSSVQPGTWKVRFAGKELLLPITRQRAWLDWDTAVSIVGHDVEVKATYANLLARRNRPELFVDIGANYGTHSLLFLVHGVPTLAFEPNSSCHPFFRDLCALNRVEGHLERIALGETDGETEIKYPERDTWFGTTNPQSQKTLEQTYGLIVERVPQRRLDAYLAHLRGRRVLIKIDTEGNEYEVLLGADKTLSECRPLIIFESWGSDSREQLHRFFAARHYEIKALPWDPGTRNSTLDREPFLGHRGTNYIAVPTDRGNEWFLS